MHSGKMNGMVSWSWLEKKVKMLSEEIMVIF